MGATGTADSIHLQQIMWPLVISALLFPAIVLCAFAVTTSGLALYALGLVYLVPLWRRLDAISRVLSSLQLYIGHKNIQHTVRYTELSATRFKDFWRD